MITTEAAATKTVKPITEEVVDNSSPQGVIPDDVINQIAAEYVPDADNAEAGADSEAAPVESENAPAEGGEPVEETGGPPEEAKERGDERLVAREVEVRLKEKAVEEREARLSTVEKENAQLKEQLAAIPVDFIDQLRMKPLEALEGAGHDPDHVVRLILAQKMMKEGKQVPAELRQAIKEAEYDYKQRALEKRQADFEQRQAAEAFAKKVEADCRTYVSRISGATPGTSKDAPTVAQVAKANAERVFTEILDEIGRDARARAQEPGAQLISFDEAARRVEKRWSEMKSLFGAAPPETASTTATATKAGSEATGASTKTKTIPQTTKPLTAPERPKTEAELINEAIGEAVGEYKRTEQARKAARA